MTYDQVFDNRFKLLRNGRTVFTDRESIDRRVFTDRNLIVNKDDIPIEQLLLSPYMYEEEHIAFVYNRDGEIIHDAILNIKEYLEYKEKYPSHTVVIRGIEGLSPKVHEDIRSMVDLFQYDEISRIMTNYYFTAHLYIAQAGSPSFDFHTDPDNVIIAVLEGEKRVWFSDDPDDYRDVPEDNLLVIPANVEHRIENIKPSIMLSIGYGKFLLDKI